MRITRLATIVGCLLSTALLSVNAQEAMDAPEPVVQKIAPMFSAKAQTISYFTAPNDMIALGVVTRDFKKQVYYTNANGDFVISGMFYDTQTKQNFNAAVNDKLVITLPEALTQGISELPSISHGSGEQVVYALVDPNCGYCKRFYQKVEQQMASGQFDGVTVKYLPVGILSQDSKFKAEAIMSLPVEERFDAMESAIVNQPINMATKPDGVSAVAQNKAFYDQFPFIGGVPFVLTQLDGEWKMNPGLPNDAFFRDVAASAKKVAKSTGKTANTAGH